MTDRLYPDLDYEFLRYIGVVSKAMRRIQGFYVPFFKDRQRVLDLGCGDGDFVEMLAEQGISAIGVDFDPKTCGAARNRGLDVVCQDVFSYLEKVEPDSFDGIFSAHLVEHLPYRQVLKMLELCQSALLPGGIILLATPNARSIYTHLESFYMHFGHVSFYHPELLGFFLNYVGFVDAQMGENPNMDKPLWGQTPEIVDFSPSHQFKYEPVLPLISSNPLRRLFRVIKMFAVRMIVQPYTDRLASRDRELIAHINLLSRHLAQMRATLDKSVECFALAYKPMGPVAPSDMDGVV